jgi:hypothetical protein
VRQGPGEDRRVRGLNLARRQTLTAKRRLEQLLQKKWLIRAMDAPLDDDVARVADHLDGLRYAFPDR